MDKLREMEIFVAIVDRGSFTGAAEKVGMSAAAISRAVNSLESRLGTHLLARTTRSVRPTDAGMAYLEACRKVLDTITDAEASIAVDQLNPVGTLTVSAPVLFGQRYVAPLVNAFALRYPDVEHQRGVRRSNYAASGGRGGYCDPCRPPWRLLDIRHSVRFCAASHLRGPLLSRRAWGTSSPERSDQSPLRVIHRRLASARVGIQRERFEVACPTPAADDCRPGSRCCSRGCRRCGDHSVAVVSGGARGTRRQAPTYPDVIRARVDPGEPASCGAAQHQRQDSRFRRIRYRDTAQKRAPSGRGRHCNADFPIGVYQRIEVERSIQSARIRYDPRTCAAEWFGLQPPIDMACAGDCRKRDLAKEHDMFGRILRDLSPEVISGQFDLRSQQLGGTRCGSRDHRCETATVLKQRAVVFGPNLFGRKACKMQDPPESIASARKVMASRRRTQTRIDSAKHQRQARLEEIRKRLRGINVSHR